MGHHVAWRARRNKNAHKSRARASLGSKLRAHGPASGRACSSVGGTCSSWSWFTCQLSARTTLPQWLAGLSTGLVPGIGMFSAQSLWYSSHGPGIGKLSDCGQALTCSCTSMPCTHVLQHMATLTGTKVHQKPPRASHKRQIPRACQLLHSGEEHPMEWTHRSSQI